MKLAIMQPTYLPWAGYFALMDSVDRFVFLDDVEFSKQSWQQRNRIKGSAGELWLTIPVKDKDKRQLIKDVLIDNTQDWQKKHLLSIKANYSRSSFFDKYIGPLEKIYSGKFDRLCDFNMKIITWAKKELGIKTTIKISSELGLGNADKVERLITICKAMKCDEYISPQGSREYIEENNLFPKENIKLAYQEFTHPKYNQLFGEFMPFLGVIDLLFNMGEESLSIIRSGNK